MQQFENRPLLIDELPEYQSVSLTPLNNKYIWIAAIRYVQILVFVIILFFIISNLRTEIPAIGLRIAFSVVVIIILLRFLFFYVTFRNRGYAVRMHDIIFRSGILEVHTVIVPISRIQNINTKQNFLERLFNLASIECYTSGTGSADIELYGIEKSTIDRIQAYLQKEIQSRENHFTNKKGYEE